MKPTPEVNARESLTAEKLVRMFEHMQLQRELEDRIVALFRQGRIVGGVFTGRGQEAIGVGATIELRSDDVIFPTHRDLGAYLLKGMSPFSVLANYLGRVGGPTRGRDGNLHMGDWSLGIGAFVSQMADTVPVAAGVALAMKSRKADSVVVCFNGDGATSRGDWFEGINLAAVLNVPAIFICVNNGFAYSTPLHRQMAVSTVAERAQGFGIPVESVDGTNVVAVYDSASKAITRARKGEGPSFIECTAFRMTGHSAADNASYVPSEYRENGERSDPIGWFDNWLQQNEILTREGIDELRKSVRARVEEALHAAEESPYPDPNASDLLSGVFAPDDVQVGRPIGRSE